MHNYFVCAQKTVSLNYSQFVCFSVKSAGMRKMLLRRYSTS